MLTPTSTVKLPIVPKLKLLEDVPNNVHKLFSLVCNPKMQNPFIGWTRIEREKQNVDMDQALMERFDSSQDLFQIQLWYPC